MRTRTRTAVAAVAIAGLAVVGTDALTYAGTGDSLILGKVNKAKQTTHVTSTGKGPALSLHASGNRPALAVDSGAKVVKLNADKVDGKDAAGLENNVRVYTATSGSSTNGAMNFELPDFPNGRYQVDYDAFLYGSAGSPAVPVSATCWLRKTNAAFYAGTTSATTDYYDIALSGSTIITKDAASWYLSCSTHQPSGVTTWEVDPREPIRVFLTRIDKTIGGSLDTARTGASGRAAR